MNRLLSILGLLISINYSTTAQISRVEYFIDNDPGYGLASAIAIVPGQDSLNLSVNIPLSSVDIGIHSLFIRSQDVSGDWSFVHKRNFYVFDTPSAIGSAELQRLEYYLDHDPGFGQGIALALADPVDSQDDYNIDLSGVAPGIHSLFVRAQNNYGQWSFVYKRNFYVFDTPSAIGSAELQRLEYYLDDDPGLGQGIALALADPVDSQDDYNIDLSDVTPGIHSLFVRAQNNYGQWSFVHKRNFYVFDAPGGDREIVEVEYYLNHDPGIGNAISLNDSSIPGEDLDIDFVVDDPEDGGNHIIYARARDNYGMWSFVVADTLVFGDNNIEVTFPNGGQAFTAGTGVIPHVDWDTTNMVNNVDIFLVRTNGEIVETIATNQDPEGPYQPDWEIPITVNSGEYRILVKDRLVPSIKDFSDQSFTINNPTNFCDGFTDLATVGEALNAASCLCELNYITPQDHGYNNTYGVQPTEDILRADLANVVYHAINQGDPISPAEFYPVPFIDLQNDDDPYFRYAKALSYLEYDDDITPFDRDFVNFRPFDPIEMKFAAKVIVEAYNFSIVNSNNGSILNVAFGEEGYNYLRTLQSMGLLTGVINPDANDFADRQDIFIITKNILDSCSGDCNAECLSPSPQEPDYAVPGLFTPFNLDRSYSMAEGHFEDYSVISYAIPGFNLPLQFTHSYHSHLTHLPKPYRRIEPLGVGWSHSYNSYIIKENGWTEQGATVNDSWIVMWPGGAVNIFDGATLAPLSDGVYDQMTMPDENTIVIQKLNHIFYTYTMFSLGTGEEIFMLDEIRDRNNNIIDIVNELAIVPRIDKVIGTAGRVLEFNYVGPGFNDIETVEDVAGGRIIHFDVDADDNLISYSDPNGHTTSYTYEDLSVQNSDPLDHLLHSITRPEGNIIRNTYDNGFLVSNQLGDAIPSTTTIQTMYTDPTANYNTEMTDGDGTMKLSQFNSNGYEMSRTINGIKIEFGHGNADDPSFITATDYEGLNTTYDYDDFGRLTLISMPLGITHRYTYNDFSDIKTYTDPRNNITTYEYTPEGNLDKVIDNMGFETLFDVDAQGQVTEINSPNAIKRKYDYDDFGNIILEESLLDIRTVMTYDAIGRLDSIINPQLQVTKYEFDDLGLLKTQIRRSDIDGDIVTNYDYDQNNNLSIITNALGNQTRLTYDNRDLLETTTFGNDTKTYTYREDGLIDTYSKPGGHTFNYQYDPLGRLLNDGYASYDYDNRDNLTLITKDDIDLEMSYDIINRLDTVSYGGFDVIYSYDNNNNLTQLQYPGGLQVDYTYDPNNRLTQVVFDGKTISYDYFDDGRINGAVLPNGTNRTYGYDDAGRLINMADLTSIGDTICAYEFTLDFLGNHVIEDRVEPLGDPLLNALDLFYTYNDENEIQRAGTVNFNFDEDGNRIMKNGQSALFDDKDMLTDFNGKSYEYDGMGLRRAVTENGAKKSYIWDVRDMGNILAETDVAGNIMYYYIHGLGLEARINATDMSAQYYHTDYRGSTIAITDETEMQTHQYSYLPFGAIVGQVESDDQPFKYVGRYGVMDEGDSLYYMRARYMDAITGRFVSEDPVWHRNLYVYAENNPVDFIDPDGNERRKSGKIEGVVIPEIIDQYSKHLLNNSSGMADDVIGVSVKGLGKAVGGLSSSYNAAIELDNGNYKAAADEAAKGVFGLIALKYYVGYELGSAAFVGQAGLSDEHEELMQITRNLINENEQANRHISLLLREYRQTDNLERKSNVRRILQQKIHQKLFNNQLISVFKNELGL